MVASIRFDTREVDDLMDAVSGATGPALQEAFNNAALLVKGEAQKALNRGPKTGKVYEKYGPRRTHRASAPGEAPATDNGSLVSSIAVDTQPPSSVSRASKAKASVGSNLEYADFLEDGTANMAARPFMKPAFLKVVPKLPKLLKHSMAKKLK